MDFDIESVVGDTVTTVARTDMSRIQIVADYASALRSAGITGGKDDKLAMTVDGAVIYDWCVKQGITWTDFWQDRAIQTRFVEDPDNAAFRVWEGRL
jgi:hypothetical protein